MKGLYKAIVAGAVLVVGAMAIFKVPRKSGVIDVAGSAETFPTVTGNNLDRVEMVFPRDFSTEYNIVFIAFQQWQQRQVNTWVPFVQGLEAERDDVMYYEFPTVWEMTAMRRTFLNEGMRAGIPDQTARERTITLYLNKPDFRSRLNIADESTMITLLVKNDGTIIQRAEGEFTQTKANTIIDAMSR